MSTGIDATVVLGLAGKAAQVFAEAGTYLSFPLSPWPIDASQLRAIAEDPLSPPGQQGLAELSQLVNEIPSGPIWGPMGEQRLWDVYGDVLAGAELAGTPRGAEEERDYQRAYGLLYETQPDGTTVASPAVLAYERYRDSYIALVQEYSNRKGQAELSTDPILRALWLKDEPILRAQVVEAERQWSTIGCRGEIEDAHRLLRKLASLSPLLVWAGYRKLFDPDLPELFFRTGPDGSMYLPAGLVPSDVLDSAWPVIRVTRAELDTLAQGAPASLRSRLAGDSSDAAVEAVSFEYSSVTVQRPWFAPEVFSSRAWRFYQSDRVLSNGGTPPSGECTSYVSGLVLGRSIKVRLRTNETPKYNFGFLPASRFGTRTRPTRPQPAAIVVARAEARRSEMVRLVKAGIASGFHPNVAGGSGVGLSRIAFPPTTPREHPAGLEQPTVAKVGAANIARIAGIRFVPSRPLENTELTAVAGDPNEIYVIAFICRWLPKSPNPDPTLEW